MLSSRTFYVSVFILKSSCILFQYGRKTWILFKFSVSDYLVFPAPFIKMVVVFQYILFTPLTNSDSDCICIFCLCFFWGGALLFFYSVGLHIYFSLSTMLFYYYSFVVQITNQYYDVSSYALFAQDCFGYLESFLILYRF